MRYVTLGMLTFAIFLPLAGAVLIALLPRGQERRAKWIAAGMSAAVSGDRCVLVRGLRPG